MAYYNGKKVLSVVETKQIEELNLANIVDNKGRQRFYEANCAFKLPTSAFELIYSKYSLSGTHIMFVACFKCTNDTTMVGGAEVIRMTVPSWTRDKIVPIHASANIVDITNAVRVRVDGSSWQTALYPMQLRKPEQFIQVVNQSNITCVSGDCFRIEFDLLIDTD